MLFKCFPIPNVYESQIPRNTCNKFRVKLKSCMVFIQYYGINKLKGKRKKKMLGVQSNSTKRSSCKIKYSYRRKLSPQLIQKRILYDGYGNLWYRLLHCCLGGRTVSTSALRSQYIAFGEPGETRTIMQEEKLHTREKLVTISKQNQYNEGNMKIRERIGTSMSLDLVDGGYT